MIISDITDCDDIHAKKCKYCDDDNLVNIPNIVKNTAYILDIATVVLFWP